MYIDFWICRDVVRAPEELNSLFTSLHTQPHEYNALYIVNKCCTLPKLIYNVHIWLHTKIKYMEYKLIKI